MLLMWNPGHLHPGDREGKCAVCSEIGCCWLPARSSERELRGAVGFVLSQGCAEGVRACRGAAGIC